MHKLDNNIKFNLALYNTGQAAVLITNDAQQQPQNGSDNLSASVRPPVRLFAHLPGGGASNKPSQAAPPGMATTQSGCRLC